MGVVVVQRQRDIRVVVWIPVVCGGRLVHVLLLPGLLLGIPARFASGGGFLGAHAMGVGLVGFGFAPGEVIHGVVAVCRDD